jgi:hypothetical protein
VDPEGTDNYRLLGDGSRAADDRRLVDGIAHARGVVYQDRDGISEAPRGRGIIARLRGVFLRRDPSPSLLEAHAPAEDAWARERHHRAEHEHDRGDLRS